MLNFSKTVYRNFRYQKPEANRIAIKKAKWLNDHTSPVMLMVDDLTNAWHSLENNYRPDFGGDWGGFLWKEGSSLDYLQRSLLDKYPQIKTVFFTVLGKLGPFIKANPFTFSRSFDNSTESIGFLRRLQFNYRFEIAYHGYYHGIPGKSNREFIQEWESFANVEDAVIQNKKGRELQKTILGEYPEGGKYGGWRYNKTADESINESDFLWWCRDWMPRDTDNIILDDFYELQYFGNNHVIAIPSTIHGHNWRKKQIDILLKKRQIISIEEHIAKIKPGSPDQKPNIYDDIKELNRLFAYLTNKNVWYATGTEVATYFIGYTNSIIYDLKKDSFKISYNGRIPNPIITLFVDCNCICSKEKPFIKVVLPNGATLARQQYEYNKNNYIHKINLPVQVGTYFVEPVSNPPNNLNGKIIEDQIVFDKSGLAGQVKVNSNQEDISFFIYEKELQKFEYLKYDTGGSYHLFCLNSTDNQTLKAI